MLLDLLSIRAGWTTRIPELVESNTVRAFGGDLRLGVSLHEISLTQEVFQKVMGDAQIIDLLRDLDVVVDRRSIELFRISDVDGNGHVSMSELISTLMKLRGDVKKSDMVAAWTALEALQTRFREFQRVSLSNQAPACSTM